MSYKDNKKIYCNDIVIIGQITPLLNQPEDISEYAPKEDKVKILRPRCDATKGEFLGLEYCTAYLTVRNDLNEQFYDYSYSKENSKLLYSTHKIKILSSFSTTIFSRHRLQYESGAFAETDLSNTFFLLSTVDRTGKINRYLDSVNPNMIDIGLNEFGEKFNPAVLDSMGSEREGAKKSVLKVSKKIADYSSQNLKTNTDGYFGLSTSTLYCGLVENALRVTSLHYLIRLLVKLYLT